ncbi:EAL domain-containing protein [Cupriavidus metallidurans]|jgi:EAL domain-containing protein (putative c-di-GMP-specific phosphodiesterase class I)|uniref:EAL domain-containing protein n=2 Tax=Burkholderiaceae TaxID=119060 RepID=A0A482IY53_9BURK|nr:EAL domain-containing protein [Cupriavidus metallidurans]QWC90677.1 EAL domain-containing protein [Cupriavidus metallidurans]
MSWMQVMHARSRESGKSDDPQAQVVEDSMESWWTPELLSVEVLRNAIDCGEFVACYQPQFDLDGGHLRGVEALARWARPGFGMIPPAAFLGALREHDLLSELTIVMIWHAAAAVRRWEEGGLALPISINAEWRCLETGRLHVALRSACQHFGISMRSLHIEVSEQTAVNDLAVARDAIRALRAEGVRIALDDFGTGATSLQLLRHIECDLIKLDQSLVKNIGRDPRAASLLGSVIGMVRAMGLKAIAEGVENFDDLECLIRLGCHQAQGFLLGAPMPEASLVHQFLKRRAPARWTPEM